MLYSLGDKYSSKQLLKPKYHSVKHFCFLGFDSKQDDLSCNVSPKYIKYVVVAPHY